MIHTWTEWWIALIGGIVIQAIVIFFLTRWAYKRGMFDNK